jgi:putative ABC transport system permease protein
VTQHQSRVLRLLARFVPGDLRESIAGDLQEEYLRLRAHRGAALAAAWLWWNAARVAIIFRWERTAHGRPLPPIGDELRGFASMWDTLRQDIVFGARMLWRQPGFTVVAGLALALGIGANTAIFSLVDAVLWRPLPYADPAAIVSVSEQRPREGRLFGPISPADFYDWRRDSQSFSSLAAYSDIALNITGAGEPERVRALAVSPGFLDVLGVAPARGTDFRPDEETFGRHRVALLTDGFWRRRFGADADIVGRTVIFDGNLYEVRGVLAPAFWWPSQPDVVVPLALSNYDRTLRAAHFLDAIARRKPGVSLGQARDELAIIGKRLSDDFPEENTGHGPNLRPVRDALVGDMRVALLVLFGAVALVLLIACANVATLLLARAAGRQKELAIRAAVGAARGRLVRQMLVESLLLALLGGGAALVVAVWSLAAVRQVVSTQFSQLPGIALIGIDVRVLGVATVVSLLTGLVFGAVPAFMVSDLTVGSALNEESRGGSGGVKGRRARTALVVAELALSLVLLVGAVLLIVSFRNLTEVSPGFQPEQVVTTRLALPSSRYGDYARVVAFYEALSERLQAVPGVTRVALTSAPPFSGLDARLNLEIERRTAAFSSPTPVRAHPRVVSNDYFATLGIPLLRGRGLTEHDNSTAPNVIVINQVTARRYWPDEDPIGQRISLGSPQQWRTIVGIVGDIRHGSLDADAEPEAYMPYAQRFDALGAGLARGMTVVMRTSLDAPTIAPLLRAAVATVDPQQPVAAIQSMEDLIARSVAPRRVNFLLLSVFALMAVTLTSAGLYGVMAYLVGQRTREISVRMALGASPSAILALVLRQAGSIMAAGIALGVLGALALTQSLTALLFGVRATDVRVYAGVSLLLAVVALLAVAVPSVRATRVDPISALR